MILRKALSVFALTSVFTAAAVADSGLLVQPAAPSTSEAPEQSVGQAAGPAEDPTPILQSQIEHLHLVNPATSQLSKPVDVQFSLEGDQLHAHFEIRSHEIYAKEHLAKGEYPYQFDVVELFISTAGQASPFPYFEFEVSPYGETFQVKIPGGKKPFQEGIDLGLKAQAHRQGGAWAADLLIPLRALGFDGDVSKLVGNAYAIVGRKPQRTFWSLTLPPQAKPNFHMPEFFRPLLPE